MLSTLPNTISLAILKPNSDTSIQELLTLALQFDGKIRQKLNELHARTFSKRKGDFQQVLNRFIASSMDFVEDFNKKISEEDLSCKLSHPLFKHFYTHLLEVGNTPLAEGSWHNGIRHNYHSAFSPVLLTKSFYESLPDFLSNTPSYEGEILERWLPIYINSKNKNAFKKVLGELSLNSRRALLLLMFKSKELFPINVLFDGEALFLLVETAKQMLELNKDNQFAYLPHRPEALQLLTSTFDLVLDKKHILESWNSEQKDCLCNFLDLFQEFTELRDVKASEKVVLKVANIKNALSLVNGNSNDPFEYAYLSMLDIAIKKREEVLFSHLITQLYHLTKTGKRFSDNLSQSFSERIVLWLGEENSLFALTTALQVCKVLDKLSPNDTQYSDKIIATLHKVYLSKFGSILTQSESEKLDQISITLAFLVNEDCDPLHFFKELNDFHFDLDKIFGIDPNHQDGETILAIIELFKSAKEGFESLSEQRWKVLCNNAFDFIEVDLI